MKKTTEAYLAVLEALPLDDTGHFRDCGYDMDAALPNCECGEIGRRIHSVIRDLVADA